MHRCSSSNSSSSLSRNTYKQTWIVVMMTAGEIHWSISTHTQQWQSSADSSNVWILLLPQKFGGEASSSVPCLTKFSRKYCSSQRKTKVKVMPIETYVLHIRSVRIDAIHSSLQWYCVLCMYVNSARFMGMHEYINVQCVGHEQSLVGG